MPQLAGTVLRQTPLEISPRVRLDNDIRQLS